MNRNTLLIILLTFLVNLLSYSSFADDSKIRCFTTGTGWGHASFLDKSVSPLLYSGSQFSAVLGFVKKSPKVINEVQLGFMHGKLYSVQREVLQSAVSNYHYEIDYSHRRRVWEDTDLNLRIFVGGSWNTLQISRIHNLYSNSANSSWFVSSLAAQAYGEFGFGLFGRNFLLHAGLDIPFIAFAVRPVYTMTAAEGFIKGEDGLKAFFGSGKFYLPATYRGLGSQTGLTWFLKNGNAIELEYRWNYFGLNDVNPVQEARHHLVFKAFFNF